MAKKHRRLKVVPEESSKTGPDVPPDEFFEMHIRPRLKSWGLSFAVMVVLAVALASWKVRAARRTAAGFAALDKAADYEELARVAREYGDLPPGVQAAFRAARQLLLDEKFDRAFKEFSAFIQDHPESSLLSAARLGMAYALEGAGKSVDAEKVFLEVARSASDAEVQAEAYVGAARCARALGKTAEAKRHCEAAISAGARGYYRKAALESLTALKAAKLALARKKTVKKAPAASAATAGDGAGKSGDIKASVPVKVPPAKGGGAVKSGAAGKTVVKAAVVGGGKKNAE
ncbi:MAG: hypothetical protein GXP31_08015 [Kiritimatiellaeota bacterium]|nr:hypothetical protein [Kiritimatiellota bacterium]